ncbi:MAG: GNAT family N-acetyltransferase [Nannocystales bacterium]
MSDAHPTALVFRDAELADIEAMMHIRNNVRENALVNTVIGREDYVQAMTTDGKAWVCERDGEVLGFSCGRPDPGDIWALFVRESAERQGIGGALMKLVEDWMFAQGLSSIWLTTTPQTKAERLYQRRGWIRHGTKPSGEAEYRLETRTP